VQAQEHLTAHQEKEHTGSAIKWQKAKYNEVVRFGIQREGDIEIMKAKLMILSSSFNSYFN
jgi:hypothetical protein